MNLQITGTIFKTNIIPNSIVKTTQRFFDYGTIFGNEQKYFEAKSSLLLL